MTYPPPNEAGQSVHVCRAAPVCAAVPYWATLTGAWVRIRNRFVGRGILDASMAHSIRGRQGCRPLHPAEKMAPTVHPTGGGGGGHGAVGDGPGDCAICGWRFGRLGISRHPRRRYLARCDGRPGTLPPGPLRFGQRAAGWQEVSARNFVSEQGPASPPYWMYGKKLGRSYGAKGPATPADTPVVSCPIEKME